MRFLAVLVLLLTLVIPTRAEDQVWSLTDGRVVTVSKVLSQTPTHVTVRCTEGLLQIDKRQLPPEVQEKYPYDSAAGAAAARQQREDQARREALAERERALTARARTPQLPPQAQLQLRIVSTRPAGPDTAYVTLVNEGAGTYEVTRDAFVGMNVAGAAFPSHHLTNPRGDVLTRIRIQPNETAEVGVVFRVPEDDAHDIATVRFN